MQVRSASLQRVTVTDMAWRDVRALAAPPGVAAPRLRTLVVMQRAKAPAPDPALLQARPWQHTVHLSRFWQRTLVTLQRAEAPAPDPVLLQVRPWSHSSYR